MTTMTMAMMATTIPISESWHRDRGRTRPAALVLDDRRLKARGLENDNDQTTHEAKKRLGLRCKFKQMQDFETQRNDALATIQRMKLELKPTFVSF